jgi:hypothetical protein
MTVLVKSLKNMAIISQASRSVGNSLTQLASQTNGFQTSGAASPSLTLSKLSGLIRPPRNWSVGWQELLCALEFAFLGPAATTKSSLHTT